MSKSYEQKSRLVTGKELQNYFESHVQKTKIPDIHLVLKPLQVFKKVYAGANPAIANLTIPRGALVHVPTYAFDKVANSGQRKMRASEAVVKSIAKRYNETPVHDAYSGHDVGFKYVVGALVRPTEKFDTSENICTSGIHFFLNVKDALSY